MIFNNKLFKVLIPARAGSKGLKNKNIRMLSSKPLIQYTIEEANNVFDAKDIFVSTDSDEIREVAENLGILVPKLRPKSLSDDSTPMKDVILHFLENANKPDYLVLLQPTSPFRKSKHILEAINEIDDKTDMVVSVCDSKYNPYWNLFEETKNGDLKKSKKGNFYRRQDIPKVYLFNGAIYIIKVDSMIKNRDLNFKKVKKYLMDWKNSIDIDTIEQLQYAEFIKNKYNI